jgi:hypothetical protein
VTFRGNSKKCLIPWTCWDTPDDRLRGSLCFFEDYSSSHSQWASGDYAGSAPFHFSLGISPCICTTSSGIVENYPKELPVPFWHLKGSPRIFRCIFQRIRLGISCTFPSKQLSVFVQIINLRPNRRFLKPSEVLLLIMLYPATPLIVKLKMVPAPLKGGPGPTPWLSSPIPQILDHWLLQYSNRYHPPQMTGPWKYI